MKKNANNLTQVYKTPQRGRIQWSVLSSVSVTVIFVYHSGRKKLKTKTSIRLKTFLIWYCSCRFKASNWTSSKRMY